MILGGIDGVDTNDIDVQCLQIRDVSGTSSWISQWVDEIPSAVLVGGIPNGRLIRHASHIKLSSIRKKEFSALESTLSKKNDTLVVMASEAACITEGRTERVAKARDAEESFMIEIKDVERCEYGEQSRGIRSERKTRKRKNRMERGRKLVFRPLWCLVGDIIRDGFSKERDTRRK
jgi:hypothetical protein